MDLAAASLAPLPGGHSGQTFLAEVAGERSVVRVYAESGPRGAAAAEVDAALLRLVRGLLPVPEVLELRRADPASGMPALLVTSYLPGVRCDLLLPDLDETGRRALGTRLGVLVADLGGMPQLGDGPFVDADLRVGTWERPEGLPELVADTRPELVAVADDAQALLDTVTRRVLVHGDLTPGNLLVDPDTLAVTGLVDWELAHAGHPFADLGSLLRFERDPVLTTAVLQGYAARRGTDPATALALAGAADLVALVELASRPGRHPDAERAERLLRAVARAGDPGAWTDPG
ncbi:MAG TPA: aminoglycoside phosphotransferase family protein [Nocardioides sp.]|uniref:phosphotransferase family protein n=1 Tax=Nocardioides sp. TaxID=35761 RepID=UPI002CCE9B9A|nr:aminoglycoside phosphotransferase family protein [Nocardioides sp.]HTW15163.1 aminoglycoside phosphotransferase family protein [Nocardioides sp.]